MNAERLLKLADFLEALPEKKFFFGCVVRGADEPNKDLSCGSVACAIGWCPVVFPELCGYSEPYVSAVRTSRNVVMKADGEDDYVEVGAALFDLDTAESWALFTPEQGTSEGLLDLDDNATPKQVAENIRRFVATNS